MSEAERRRHDWVSLSQDDLDDFLEEELRDPAFRSAYDDATARSALLRALVRRRADCGLSQAEVAALMGTTQSAVSDLERGATDPRLSTLQRFARAVACQLRLALSAGRPRPRSWFASAAPAGVAWPMPSVVGSRPPMVVEYLGKASHATPAPAGIRPATRVAPVELRAQPDGFARAAAG